MFDSVDHVSEKETWVEMWIISCKNFYLPPLQSWLEVRFWFCSHYNFNLMRKVWILVKSLVFPVCSVCRANRARWEPYTSGATSQASVQICAYKHLRVQVCFQPDMDDQHCMVIMHQCNLNSSWVYMIENDDNISMHWWAEGNPQGSELYMVIRVFRLEAYKPLNLGLIRCQAELQQGLQETKWFPPPFQASSSCCYVWQVIVLRGSRGWQGLDKAAISADILWSSSSWKNMNPWPSGPQDCLQGPSSHRWGSNFPLLC